MKAIKVELSVIQERYRHMGLRSELPIDAVALAAGLVSKSIVAEATTQAGATLLRTSERGLRPTPENQIKRLYRLMWVDPELRQTILDIRHLDRVDGRVKKIHKRTGNLIVKGGLKLKTSSKNKKIIRLWKGFEKRLQLNKHVKLLSDARGLQMEGNLPLQWVLSKEARVVGCVRMPSETIRPKVGVNGRFDDPMAAYDQHEMATGRVITTFPLWQLSLVRLDPDNYDDLGCMGRPLLDASREVWQKLQLTEEDLVIRRHTRAAQRKVHVLEGASEPDIAAYKETIENEQGDQTTDYFLNRKGGVTALQGDENLDQIKDVVHLLDTFFSGAPGPKGLFGYTQGLNRDILEDLKKDYFEEIDALQDTQSFVYELGFRLDLLLQGINPDSVEFTVQFAERRTDTPNQRADLALKHQALGVPYETNWDTAGLDPAAVLEQRKAEQNSNDPYPDTDDGDAGSRPRVSVTPGNQKKGESATTISTRN